MNKYTGLAILIATMFFIVSNRRRREQASKLYQERLNNAYWHSKFNTDLKHSPMIGMGNFKKILEMEEK